MTFDKRTKSYRRYRDTMFSGLISITCILAITALIAYINLPVHIPVSPLAESPKVSPANTVNLIQVVEASEEQSSEVSTELSVEDKIRKAWGKAEGDNAVKVAFCESSLNPYAEHKHSSAAGLFQIIRGTWNGYKCTGSPTNADDNIACAYKIYQANGWGHTSSWAASKGCHGLD